MPNPANKIIFTETQHQFLRDNFKTFTNKQLANALGLNLTRTRTELYSLGLKRMELQYWTDEQVKFLKENYTLFGDTELAEIFEVKWYKNKGWTKKHIEKKRRYLKLKRTSDEIANIRKRNALQNRYNTSEKAWETRRKNSKKKPIKKRRKNSFTKREDVFLEKNYLKFTAMEIAKILERSEAGTRSRIKNLGLIIPAEITDQRIANSRFKTGHIPSNKGKKQTDYMSEAAIEKTKETRFKKGDRPASYKTGEHISKDGYIVKSIGEGKVKLKHIYVWEKANNKKLPKGYCLSFLDGDRTNCNINNLELISRQENMLRNSKHNFPKEIIPTMALISQINTKIKTIQDGKQ